MDLKELLGEELYKQLMEKVGDNKVAVVSDGNWFPKSKFDEVNDDNKELKKQLKDRDAQLDELSQKAKGNEDLTKQIQDLQDANKATVADYESKLQKQAFDSKLNDALRDAKAKNPRAVKALLDTESIKLDGDKLLGLEDQLKALRESDDYLFTSEEGQLGGRNPNPSKKEAPKLTKDQFKNMSYQERVDLYQKDPETYNQLKGE
ncbi:phage scaffolding protein [Alkalihalophilus pseudofirmus]|uniref:Phage scaffolding protein n=1 Tax=Alkalihalophilus pseudofirmus TaxID=79885 RepID=A0AAJ2KZA8_ALKPS|nr:phage scaffolding protein [Alkalihalophilus pseudofirmus]MDV2883829.1 phage scaffolding protein [Alkalihalophilus pseudofirmus]